jgi:hypothetical protein
MGTDPEGCIYSVHVYEQRVWLWLEGSMGLYPYSTTSSLYVSRRWDAGKVTSSS